MALPCATHSQEIRLHVAEKYFAIDGTLLGDLPAKWETNRSGQSHYLFEDSMDYRWQRGNRKSGSAHSHGPTSKCSSFDELERAAFGDIPAWLP